MLFLAIPIVGLLTCFLSLPDASCQESPTLQKPPDIAMAADVLAKQASQEPRTLYKPTGERIARIVGLAVSPDGKFLVSGNVDHDMKLWDLTTGKEVRTFSDPGWRYSMMSWQFLRTGK
jgi:WD40 repeat protein